MKFFFVYWRELVTSSGAEGGREGDRLPPPKAIGRPPAAPSRPQYVYP